MTPPGPKIRPSGPCASVKASTKTCTLIRVHGPLEFGVNSKRTPHPPAGAQAVTPPPPSPNVVPKRLPDASKARALGMEPSAPLNAYSTVSVQGPVEVGTSLKTTPQPVFLSQVVPPRPPPTVVVPYRLPSGPTITELGHMPSIPRKR